MLRNIFALAPLITRELALFRAVTGYQQNLQLHPSDATIPFLQMWQDGFHHTTWFTFSLAAGLDVLLLITYLIIILLAQWLERNAHKTAVRFIESLSIELDKLVGDH